MAPEHRLPNVAARRSGNPKSEIAVAFGIVALGVYLAVGSLAIRFGAGYDRIGPRFFPYLVAAGLILSGIWLAVSLLPRRRARPEPEDTGELDFQTSASALGYLGLALLLSLVLLERAGFVLSSSVLFWLVARAFQSRRPVRDAGVAMALSLSVYLAFTKGLRLTLPRGFFDTFF